MRALLAVFVLLLFPSAAQAQDLTYRWVPGEELHYRFQLYMNTPYSLRLFAGENLDARMGELQMVLLARCVAREPMGKIQRMDCEIDRALLGGSGVAKEQDRLDEILNQYAETYEGATVQLEWTPYGRVRSIDLEGVIKGTSREALVHEYMRMLVSRAFGALEVELPKGGDDKGRTWKQKGSPLAMRLPSTNGTAGGVRLLHEVADREGEIVVIQSGGEGIVQSNASMDSSQNQTVSLVLGATARFDSARGLLVKNEQTVQGLMTAQAGTIGQGLTLNQFAMVDLLDSFDEVLAEMDQAKAVQEDEQKTTREVLTIDPTIEKAEILPTEGDDEAAEEQAADEPSGEAAPE